MKHLLKILVAAIMMSGISLGNVNAQSLSEYTSEPPTISDTVTPNVLLLLDKSGSMGRRADCDLSTGSDFTTCPTFLEATDYSGIFDSLKCYTYDGTDSRFEETATVKASVSTACGNTEWDGNFLNWVGMRRIDGVKQALIGGSCVVARAADGTCPPTGTPSKVTVKGVDDNVFPSGATVSTPGIGTGGGTNAANGRIPSTVQAGLGSTMYLHLIGHDDILTGYFCVDDDTDPQEAYNSDCHGDEVGSGNNDPSGFKDPFKVQVAMDVEPTGIIQEVGSNARFGLMEFKGDDGAQVMVPVGARQTIEWNGTTVKTFTSNTIAMLDAIEETDNQGNTPLAESLYEAIRYVAQVNSTLFPAQYVYPLAYSPGVSLGSSGIGSLGSGEITALTGSETCPSGYIGSACGRDPYFFGSNHTPAWASTSTQFPCCKTFILVLTDGEPTEDQTIPAALQDYADAAHGTHCTGTHGVPFVDPPGATCNTDPATPDNVLLKQHRTDYGTGSHFLDDVAYWGHITDLRQATIPVISETGHDLPGIQNVTVYTFFAFGNINGREILMQTAKQGAFNDKNGNNLPDLPDEYDELTNATGAVGPDGIPDAYFEANNAKEIKAQMNAAITSILQKSGSGSAASVLASSTTGEGALYQSFFFPTTPEEVVWTGYTQGLFLDAFGNLREDNGDATLVYKDDYILQMKYDTVLKEVLVDRFEDLDENGIPDSPSTPIGTVLLKDVNNIWEAGEQLALKDASTRRLLTWVDQDGNGTVETKLEFDNGNGGTNNSAVLAPYLRAEVAPSLYTADAIINFIRGCEPSTCADQVSLRDRQLTVGGSPKVWKLGDAIHAQPVMVGAPALRFDVLYGDSSYTPFFAQYKDRRQVAYVGANDGMLHAFNGGYYHRGDDPSSSGVVEHGWFTRTPTNNSSGPMLGDELWGYIPQELLPHVRWLADPNYTHVYYVDLKPKVTDARIFTPDIDHPNGWGTILMGGFRMGGSCGNCTSGTGAPPMQVTDDWDYNAGTADTTRTFYSAYFVMDITNPEVDPVLLWSFSSADLGLTTAVPSMLRVNPTSSTMIDDTNAKWYMIVGSGLTGYDGGISQSSQMYAIDLETGPGANNIDVEVLPAEPENSFMSSTVTIDRNRDYRVNVTYMGSVIHDGSLPWRGKLFRLATPSPCTTPLACGPKNWGITVGSNQEPTEVLNDFNGGIELGPVSASPTVTIDDSNKLWVFAGTGRYYGVSDRTSVEQQYFVGVKDEFVNEGVSGTCVHSKTGCEQENLINVSGASVCVLGVGTCGGTTDQVTGVAGATDFPSLISLVAANDGWYTTLPTPGERALVRPLAFAGIVFFPTFTTGGDACSADGTSELYALYYLTGSAYSSPIIGTTPSGSNNLINRSTSLGEGLATEAVVHIGHGSKEGKVNICSQNSHGQVNCTPSGTTAAFYSRFLSWHQPKD